MEEKLLQLLDAAKRGDAATLDPMLTADFTYTHATTAIDGGFDAWLDAGMPSESITG